MKNKTPTWIKYLTAYYGTLQSLHLAALIRAGLIMLVEGRFPFPILPPPGGWTGQTLPFLIGLGATDVVGIALGIAFAYRSLFTGQYYRRLGVISLTIFITGAIVFAVGTFPSGAWGAHPFAYWVMAPLFAPVPLLYVWLLRSNLYPKQSHKRA